MSLHRTPTGTTPFEPAADYTTGIRGGPLVPSDVDARLDAAGAARVVSAPPGRYTLVYSETAPTGQRFAIGLGLLGLIEQIDVLSVERGRLTRATDGGFAWSPVEPDVLRRELRSAAGARLPALVGPSGVVSNDPYRTLFELATASAREETLYPRGLSEEQRMWTARVFRDLHVGVYRAGSVRVQDDYQEEVDRVERLLCDVDARLAESPYLVGEQTTDADVWLYCLLVRFDQVYSPAFRLHRYRVRDFPSLHRFTRELYGRPLFSTTTSFDAISYGYYRGIPFLDRGITPVGPGDLFLR